MNQNTGINVLSLFDGISVAQLALKQPNIPINNYYASEIDKRAIKVTQHHFENTLQLGDIRNIDGNTLPPIDLLVSGSPCQNLSSLKKNREGLDGDKSSLFFHALRLLQETKPKYWLFENVGSMSRADKNRLDELLGVEGVSINSNLVSAQNRHRIYWTNIPLTIPFVKHIILDNIISDGYVDRVKANCVLTKNVSHTKKGILRYLTKSLGNIVYTNESFSRLSKSEKIHKIQLMPEEDVKSLFRLFTIQELERLQTLPDGYTNLLKKTSAAHAIGNGFTMEVIKHILASADL